MRTHLLMHHVSSRVFWQNTNRPGESAHLQPRFGALGLLAFPKTKISIESEEISDHRWDSENYNGTAGGDWENSVRSQGADFEADWGIIVLCTVFLVSCIFFSKCLYFSQYMAGYLLDRPHMCVYLCTHTHMHIWVFYVTIYIHISGFIYMCVCVLYT